MTNEETAMRFAYDHLRNDGDEEAETLNCTRKQFVEDLAELLEQTRQEAREKEAAA